MKWLIGIIIMVIVLAGIGYVGLKKLSTDQQSLSVTPTLASPLSPTHTTNSPNASPSSSVNDPVTPSDSEMGTVTGKLCYPSEVIPEGIIEAKRVTDNVLFTQEYIGSLQGGKSTYEFELEPGTYILRYGADAGGTGDYMYGYHTENCPTGTETTCGDTENIKVVPIEVMPGELVSGYHLCNFYYSKSNEPEF